MLFRRFGWPLYFLLLYLKTDSLKRVYRKS